MRKTPDYLKYILAVFIVIFLSLSIIAVFSNSPEGQAGNGGFGLDNIDLSSDLISENLISYIKKITITQPVINDTSPIWGNLEAPITIFEFSCFQCPASRDMQPILKQLIKDYPDEIKIVWKDLPIQEIYPDAEFAHLAGRCAQKQDKFWQYHNKLWDNQDDFSLENLKDIASDIGLNEEEFQKCLENRETAEIVNSDINESSELLIPGTPHFYINTQEIFGIATLEDFKRIIDIEMATKLFYSEI